MPPLAPTRSIIDLTLDVPLPNTKKRKSLQAEPSIEIVVDISPPKKRATVSVASASPRKRAKTTSAPVADVIEILDDDNERVQPVASGSGTGGARENAVASGSTSSTALSGDELFARALLQASQDAASAKDAADAEAARRLLEEEQQQYIDSLPKNTRDEKLALRLQKEEQREQDKLLKAINGRKEGLVFRVVVNVADGTLADGSPAHPDDLARFEPWRAKFINTGVRIKRFHWTVNYELEKRFEEARVKLTELMGRPPEEKELFHGTPAKNIDSILDTGFRIGGVGKHRVANGRAFGVGIYLAANPQMSMGFAADADRIFACRVLVGRTTGTVMRRAPKGVMPGKEAYESWTCANESVYVVRYSCLVLPCYMIEFDRNVNDAYPGAMGALGATGMPPGMPGMPAFGVAPPAMPLFPGKPNRLSTGKGKGRA